MLSLIQDRPLLISSLIDFAAEFHGDREIVTRTVEGPLHRSNYRELQRRSKQAANALIAMGVQTGDRVATLAWNTCRHMELYYAVSGIGAVLHTINPRLFPEQIEYIANHAEDKFIFFDLTFLPLLEKVAPQLNSVRGYVLMTDREHMPEQTTLANLICYEDWIQARTPEFAWPVFDERTASSLCYTSGTTGNPKGVLYGHRSTVLHSYAVCMRDGLSLSTMDNALVIVPLFHANAWGVPYGAAMCGAKLVLPGPHLDGKSIYNLLAGEECNFSLGVPTVWLNFFAYLDANPEVDRTKVRLERVVIGGSAAPRAMIERFATEFNTFVLHAWGMTEMSPLGTVGTLLHKHRNLPLQQRLDYQSKQGRAVYGVDLKIEDDNGNPLPHDGKSSGNLKVRGPWITSGYFKEEGGRILDQDGFFTTGDVANLDPDGYMQITDRAKDVIKSGGEWISSIDLENAAVGHPEIQEAAVIGLPHEKWQERPLLLVVRKPGSSIDKDGVLRFLADRIVKWWMPDDVIFVDELPHTATGKLLKTRLRDQFKDYRLPG
ncbi:MAG: long-chain-fatty-acid--CoA ligase [Bryobacteraceae bacterium]|nr:long-chain-fatty-acid--CoA ligase [Bryobacteraceae bacterium]